MSDDKKDEVVESEKDTTVEVEETSVEGEEATPAIDYEAELLKEKELRKKAEEAIIKSKLKKKVVEDDEDEDEEDRPVTVSQMQEMLANERQATQKEMLSGQIKDYAVSLAGSTAEADYIVEIHKNRTWPANLSIKEQIEEAHAIANRKRINSETSELKRALRSKETASGDTATSHPDAPKAPGPKLPAELEASYKRAGFENVKGEWQKKLPNGKIAVKNTSTGKITLK